MKKLLSIFSLLVPALLSAQTYFYINSIGIDPAAPTDQDNISISVNGDLSNTGSYIVSATSNVVGNTVTLNIDADSQGGLSVLVPHSEILGIGMLAPGIYTIQISGANISDNAPQPQHQFTVTGLGTGIDENTATNLKVNYIGGVLQLNANDGTSIGAISIYDINGKELHVSVLEKSIHSIDIDAPAGVYFLKHDGGIEKFVIGQ